MDLLIFFGHFQGIVGFLALLTFFYYLWRASVRGRTKTNHNDYNVNKAAPEAAGAWPIIGHLPQLVGPRPFFRILGSMADKYGSIFMVRFGMYPTLVVSSWEMAKECFTSNDRFLAGRPAIAVGKYLGYDFAMFAFSSYGTYWRETRKISTLELLSHRRIEFLKHVPYTEIDNSIKQLHKLWMETQNKNKQGDHQVNVDMSQLFESLTLNTMLKLVIGKGIFDNDYINHEHEEGRKLHKTMLEFFKQAGVLIASDILPFLGWLDVDGQRRNMKRIAKEIDLIAERWLQEHKQKRLTSNDKAGVNDDDFMDVLLSILDDDDSNFFNYNRDTVIKATSLTLILAGSDTTSMSLTWALTLLVTNPGALRKAQEELDTKVGRNKHVEERDIENLVYLQAIVKETLRMYPPGPLIPHEATQDCTVGGYQVTTGTLLVVNVWKLQRDPHVWPNPSEFRPERFLLDGCEGGCSGEAANKDFRGQHFEYIPFGSGRRMCPGVNLAIQILHMTLARLLHAFEFQVPLSQDKHHIPAVIDMTEGSGLTMPKVTPLQVLLKPRLPLPLYEL